MSNETEMRAILQELHDKFNTRVYGTSSYIKRDMRDRIAAALATPAPAQPDPLHVANERGEGEPVAWVRRHPDGSLTTELLPNAMIEPVRKTSGGWLPLYPLPAAPKEKP